MPGTNPTGTTCRVHDGLFGYTVHLIGWMMTVGLASYGSVSYATPHPVTWVGERPRYWRHEARDGLRACESFLRQPPTRST
jgi:hypothetical protein